MKLAVSGIGLVTPLGSSRERSWARLLAGESGIAATPTGLEARVIDFSPNGARSRMGDFALMAAEEALTHAGFNTDELNGQPIGCAVSQSKPVCSSSLDASLLLSSFTGWSPEALIKREFNLSGPSLNVVAACATGIASIQIARMWIEAGLCDMVLAGAAESSLNDFYQAGFERMNVLVPGSDPRSMRPFDQNRSGFAMGEGAAVLVIESEASVEKRNQKPLAWLGNVRMAQGSVDPIRFDPDGSAIASLIKSTLGGKPFPDYINAHGTATRFNDVVETRGIRKAFGDAAVRIPVSSTKAATGHLLGAAGAVEAALAVLALRDQIVPPTLNLTSPDPECDLDYVPHRARKTPLRSTMSMSYGFGGQMGGVLFSHD